MNGLTAFKNKIFKYGIVATAIIELASIPLLGFDVQFLYGLALGTAIAIVNFNLMAFTFQLVLERHNASLAFIGYLIRLAVYGAGFIASLHVGMISAMGTALGYLTLKLAMFYLHGLKAEFSKGRTVREEPEELQPKKHWYDFKEYEELDN
ncbi:ATP synthase subunit I [Anoxybacterium hadale]|uniref:ATP synthase subunit I n=1 Tax=Anoxybacterium hadale TaxID=3408580 RepID=A0ACD1ADV6_9FIRM|nr:ATP synthase subunit I [Clostridiales bacterium]